jgi:hypothetical protein
MRKPLLFFCLIVTIYLQAADDAPAQLKSYEASITSYKELLSILERCQVPIGPATCVAVDYDETIAHKYVLLPGNKRIDSLVNEETKNPDDPAFFANAKALAEIGLSEDQDLAVEAFVRGGYADLVMNALLLYSPDGELPKHINQDPNCGLSVARQVAKSYLKKYVRSELKEDESIIKEPIKFLQKNGVFTIVASAGHPDEVRAGLARSIGFRFWVSGANKFGKLNGIALNAKVDGLWEEKSLGTPLEMQQRFMEQVGKKPIDGFEALVLVDNSKASIDTFLNAAQAAKKNGTLNSCTKIVAGILYRPESNEITVDKLLKEFNDISGENHQSSSESECWGPYLRKYVGLN